MTPLTVVTVRVRLAGFRDLYYRNSEIQGHHSVSGLIVVRGPFGGGARERETLERRGDRE